MDLALQNINITLGEKKIIQDVSLAVQNGLCRNYRSQWQRKVYIASEYLSSY